MYHARRFNTAIKLARNQLRAMLQQHQFPIMKLVRDKNPTMEELCLHRPYGRYGLRYITEYECHPLETDQHDISVRFRLDGFDLYTDEQRFTLQTWLNNICYTNTDDGLTKLGILFNDKELNEQKVWDYIEHAMFHYDPKKA